jgi:hypothetical protein
VSWADAVSRCPAALADIETMHHVNDAPCGIDAAIARDSGPMPISLPPDASHGSQIQRFGIVGNFVQTRNALESTVLKISLF